MTTHPSVAAPPNTADVILEELATIRVELAELGAKLEAFATVLGHIKASTDQTADFADEAATALAELPKMMSGGGLLSSLLGRG